MKIKESIQLGSHTLNTRIVMPPVATYRSTEHDGNVTDEMLDYYGKRAANKNVGLIITERRRICGYSKKKI